MHPMLIMWTCQMTPCNVPFMQEIKSKFKTNMATIQRNVVLMTYIMYAVSIPSYTLRQKTQYREWHLCKNRFNKYGYQMMVISYPVPCTIFDVASILIQNSAKYQACIYNSF